MRLYGKSIPLDCGGYAVLVICPNNGSYERLMIEVGRIEADAFAPTIALADNEPHATGGGMATHYVEPEEGQPLSDAIEALAESIESREVSGPSDIGLNVGVESHGGTN